MRHTIETGTDVASVCFFDPAALPADFDDRVSDGPFELFEELEKSGKLWWLNTGADGAYSFSFYVDEKVPNETLKYCQDPKGMDSIAVPSGKLYACGAEYVANNPDQGNRHSNNRGLLKYPHLGGMVSISPGNYSVTAWCAEWPEEMVETRMKQVVGSKRMWWFERFCQLLMIIFFGLIIATVVAAFYTISPRGRRELGGEGLLLCWGVLIITWLAWLALMRYTAIVEKNPSRRKVLHDFPSIVVQMQSIA